ncbi:MAG: SpoIIE family protein phosphatase [Lachnospiraceae bacterium]|nr:SpoIIE family protein phosphatase [Lachnospiraceae bacterium]
MDTLIGKNREYKNTTGIFSSYNRLRIEHYAEAFHDLAFNFTKFDQREMREGESRGEYLARRKESEHWQRLGMRYSDAAVMMDAIAEECYSCRKPHGFQRASLYLLLRRENVELKSVYEIYNRHHHREYCLSMQVVGGRRGMEKKSYGRSGLCETETAAAILSGVLRKKILPADNCPVFIGDECRDYLFVEEGRYHVSTGTASMTKAGEKISGDNYSFLQGRDGKMMALLSDGVGSGEEACRDSGHLVDLAEKYLETGFDKKQMLGVLEGIMMGNAMENRMPTLDLCEIDLHTGECELVKLGSAPTLIKFDRLMDEIPSDNLLLGYEKIENISIVNRQLKEDNYIFMMTDGVADYFKEEEKKELFAKMLGSKGYSDPTVLANYIMDKAVELSDSDPAGKIVEENPVRRLDSDPVRSKYIRDDMTVLVLKIEQTAD